MANRQLAKKRRERAVVMKREKRHKLRAEHKCIICAKKVKPLIVYPQYCKFHFKQQKEKHKLRQVKNVSKI